MAQKLLSLEEAAQNLGITPEELTQLREENKISGVRVGANWKFKEQEVERYAEERAGGDDLGLDHDVLGGEAPDDTDAGARSDVVLLSEATLGVSSPSTSSTVIGKASAMPRPESDLDLSPPGSGSDVKLVPQPGKPDSDLKLVATGSSPSIGASPAAAEDDDDIIDLAIDETRGSSAIPLGLGGSDIAGGSGTAGSSVLGSGSSGKMGKGGSSALGGSSGKVGKGTDSGLSLGSDALSMGSDALTLEGSGTKSGSSGGSSGLGGKGSDLELGAFEDDDLVLGTLSGSDVSMDPSSSGISLADPDASGLSLEEPLELGIDDGGGLAAEDTFDLTPTAEYSEDDSSGSQVIALDSEADFDDAAATMLGEDVGAGTMLEEDTSGMAMTMEAVPGMAPPAMAPMPAGMPGMQMGVPPMMVEAPYSVLNVIGLFFCVLFLTLTGMLMYDLLRNMWAWDGPYAASSSLMNMIVGLFE